MLRAIKAFTKMARGLQVVAKERKALDFPHQALREREREGEIQVATDCGQTVTVASRRKGARELENWLCPIEKEVVEQIY